MLTMQNKITTQSLPETLKNFDQLPDSAFVRQPTVQALYACSAASIWRAVNAGRIPKPYKISLRTTGWNVGELRTALAAIRDHAAQEDIVAKMNAHG